MPGDCSDHDVGGEVERAMLMVLLDGRQLLWSREELMREVAGLKGNRSDVSDAIANLYGSGLVHVIDGEFLLATRAATQGERLGV